MYAKRFVRGTAIVFVFNVLAALVAYAFRVVLARKLPAAEYGLFFSVFTLMTFLLFFRDLGLGQALVKYIPEFIVRKDWVEMKTSLIAVFFMQGISSAIFGVVLYLLAPWLALNYFKDPRAETMIILLIIYIFTSVFFRNWKYLFQGFQKMAYFSSFELGKNFTVLFFTLIFLNLGFGILSPVYGYVVSIGVLALIFAIPALKLYPSGKSGPLTPASRKLLAFGIPVIFTHIGSRVISSLDTLLLTYFVPLEQVGIYNAVLPSAITILFLGKSITSVLFPMTSELWIKGEMVKIKQTLNFIRKYSFVIFAPFIVGGIIYAGFFLKLLFGAEYVAGELALQFILIGVLFYLVAGIQTAIISAIGQPKQVTKIILIAAGLNGVLNLFLIPKYGMAGAGFATAVSYIYVFFHSSSKLDKIFGTKMFYGRYLLMLLPLFLFLVVVLFVANLVQLPGIIEIFLSCFIGLVFYVVACWRLGLLEFREWKALHK